MSHGHRWCLEIIRILFGRLIFFFNTFSISFMQTIGSRSKKHFLTSVFPLMEPIYYLKILISNITMLSRCYLCILRFFAFTEFLPAVWNLPLHSNSCCLAHRCPTGLALFLRKGINWDNYCNRVGFGFTNLALRFCVFNRHLLFGNLIHPSKDTLKCRAEMLLNLLWMVSFLRHSGKPR